MHQAFYFCWSKVSSYKVFNTTTLGLVLLALLVCYTIRAFLNFHYVEANYNVLLNKEHKMRGRLSNNALQELQEGKEKDLIFLKNLSCRLRKYQIVLPNERIVVTPEQFQDQLQKDVLLIQEKAKRQSVVLPSLFFLGLPEYERVPPLPEEVIKLSKQELSLFWIVDHLSEYSHLKLLQFYFENKTKSLAFVKAEQLGHLTIKFTTNESSFQKLFNEIENGPYYFVIEKIVVENSNKNAPAHSLENKDGSIKIILGREQINVLMTMSIIDFSL